MELRGLQTTVKVCIDSIFNYVKEDVSPVWGAHGNSKFGLTRRPKSQGTNLFPLDN